MAKDARLVRDPHQKEIVKLFSAFDGSKNRRKIFEDFVVMTACMYSNLADLDHREEREQMYMDHAKQYRKSELDIFAKMIAEIVMGMEDNPDQDFLGEMYMALDFGSSAAGQFFTPYSVCQCMAAILSDFDMLKAKIDDQGFVSVNDPACGAGALLMAFANESLRSGINPQTQILFTAQDIDFTVGCMCYIGMCVRGLAGYVVIGDTLCNPSTSYDRRGLLPVDKGNIWYTPMFLARLEWAGRRMAASMDLMFSGGRKEKPAETTLAKPPAPPVAVKAPEPVMILPEPEAQQTVPEPLYSETGFGQLTFF